MSFSVVSVGARTPFGLDARTTALTFRAGLIPLRANPFAGRDGDPVLGGFVPTLAWDQGATARAIELGVAAAREALLAIPERRPAPVVGVVAATSSGGASEAAKRLRADLGLGGDAPVEVVDEGEGSAADLLPRVEELLGARGADVILWGGLHSDAGSEVIRALVESDRLFDGEHLDAVVPGEAAAFVALARPGSFAKELGKLVGHGAETTAARPDNDEPVDGTAMTEAVVRATREPAGWVLFDVGYEALRLREWEVVQVRARGSLGDPYLWDALPQRMGRPGAATLPFSGALAAASAAVGHVPAARVLGLSGTDAGRRAAVAWQVG